MKKKIISLILLCMVCIAAFSASAYSSDEVYALNEVEIKVTPDGQQSLACERETGKPLTGLVKTLDDQNRVVKETPYVNGVIHGTVKHYRGDRVTFEELYENGDIGGLVYY